MMFSAPKKASATDASELSAAGRFEFGNPSLFPHAIDDVFIGADGMITMCGDE